MVCCLGLTLGISCYINRLLQPLYDQATRSTTFFKASNAVHALENYTKEARLQSNTLFATVHVNHLCTIMPHEQLTEPLQHFLYDYVPDRQVQGLTVDAIIELIRFVLQNQYFIFDNKIYRKIKGCGFGQPQLRTTINHDNDIEPRGLSFISNHPPVMYSTLIQACLMHSAVIRSKVSDFHNERRDVQIVFLNNGYSINFITEHVEQLFQDFHISNWKSNLNQSTYDKMREEIIEYDQQHQEMKIKQR
ncbi:unnamed protein product [Rotaria sp. Silwood1]|nr:unnamed protein product [Rotaria sp. Silwood1]CAF5005753.1 unnamed protein product [Rotaria sp. Silwood1]CAF5013206.1 unnamed protein product [Rotaria sp. Silwood1]CAF5085653.1 unnamed protein product [Rotaria sp. Silwood1]